MLTRIVIPSPLRRPAYTWFARRYGAALDEMSGELPDYRSFAAFFQRPLRDGARPVANAAVVWPCDGRVVTAGPIHDNRIEQVKGVDYGIADLVGNPELATSLKAGSQATIYLSPGDYHRVHSPFAGRITAIRRLRGTLYPVNPPAVAAIPQLFIKNARCVFDYRLADNRPATVIMVGALNVGDITPSVTAPAEVARGQEIGRFGFGSTVVAILPRGGPAFAPTPPATVVRTGQSAGS